MRTEAPCPFCQPDAKRLFHVGPLVIGLWDAFPASDGHALLVPKRHVASWFDATAEERAELALATEIARREIEKKHAPAGYNIGVNVGAAAGQTVFHLHVHVIPRYEGDVPDPRGGVRHVIPAKGNYRLKQSTASPRLVRGLDDPLLGELVDRLADAARVEIAVAFALTSGVQRLRPHLVDLVARGSSLHLLVGDYLDVTEPNALRVLLDLAEAPGVAGRVELKVFETARSTGFHPKAYVFSSDASGEMAYVGSSNLSRAALETNIEWNYRVVEPSGVADVRRAFRALWTHAATRPLTNAWVDAYAKRRRTPLSAAILPPGSAHPVVEDAAAIEVEPPPAPHPIQAEALAALRATREDGNAAALVVLATGLGKTWLAAFDSEPFARVLFVAHRDEILAQAFATFRRIRPAARLGYFTGAERAPDADVVFASVQTLSRAEHLERFARDAFDYVVVDEFHHAAARTYRRLLDHFTPRFLLGLTATPERTDGGDLLALCGENRAYACDLTRGIDEDLLSPFRYFGVPDDVDYANIPWRSTRFDEAILTEHLATRRRAENALEQFRKHGGRRTIGFCASQKHADFMARFFADAGVRAVAVHAGPTSAARAQSLERLERGELDVIFAVDLFNEGVDVPHVDTVMMLRPTESRIVFLQQLGRGLRRADGKPHLTVIDYIGNHRVFLTKVQALLGLEPGDHNVAEAMRKLDKGKLDLPKGCAVTYDLQARDILQSLLRVSQGGEALRAWYEQFKALRGARPTATEALHEGWTPRAVRPHYGSWLAFVDAMGDLSTDERHALREARAFLDALESTRMTRSYKMVVLLAMLAAGRFPGEIGIDALVDGVARICRRSARLRRDVSVDLEDRRALRRLIVTEPVAAWTGASSGSAAHFAYEGGTFRSTVASAKPAALAELTRELVELRLAQYLQSSDDEDLVAELKVAHNARNPILFLDRKKYPKAPEGKILVAAEGRPYEADLVKIAMNVLREPGEKQNALPYLLRRWFGPNAGASGTAHHVVLTARDGSYVLRPREAPERPLGAELLKTYKRRDIPPLFGGTFHRSRWERGYARDANQNFLLVTLEKDGLRKEHAYADRFLSPQSFQWQSPNDMSRSDPRGVELRDHVARGVPVHLFVRKRGKIGDEAAPFRYLGPVRFRAWKGDGPITVQFDLEHAVPEALWGELGIAG